MIFFKNRESEDLSHVIFDVFTNVYLVIYNEDLVSSKHAVPDLASGGWSVTNLAAAVSRPRSLVTTQ